MAKQASDERIERRTTKQQSIDPGQNHHQSGKSSLFVITKTGSSKVNKEKCRKWNTKAILKKRKNWNQGLGFLSDDLQEEKRK